MTGLNMVAMADENGKTYECKYGTYNKKEGFTLTTWTGNSLAVVNKMLHEDVWTVKKDVVNVTIEDIKKLLKEKYGDNYKLNFEIKRNNDSDCFEDFVKEFVRTL